MSWGSRIVGIAAVLATAGCTPVPLAWILPGDRAFVLPTGAMEPTLLIGDRLWANEIDPDDLTVRRGDIVIFRYPIDPSQTFIKRVVGMPGDRLKIQNKALILNGKTVDEPYAVHKTPYVDAYRDYFPATPNVQVFEPALEMLEDHVEEGELIVPNDHYFVMGDNRDLSLDSRYWGLLPKDLIFAKPLLIYFSLDVDPQSETETIRWDRIGLKVEPFGLGEQQ